ncbi:NrdR family transcriptional regulator [Halodesulfovibrio spirochaetisodalis]|uniref:Transcriptional repressor NrdR-like N-terminal domain-containing protein n=1 Tax=Halodesulfovibrio spirochaetisodalis TaxID=1560234 RepID=A0A1B7XDM9_9BACT|nr:hypothetical protein [Halodesulfovibrio spirochaetisodalis]OBQ52111.1 hypothetical protein SP90_07970 [Halodesulfovibrio spirochaetisodalis]
MLCPKCGGKTHVPRSNVADEEYVVRQRVCKQCGNKAVSVEVFLSSMQNGLEYITKEKLSDLI